MARARLVRPRGGLASELLRMGGAGTSGAHSLASSIVFSVFFIVSFVFFIVSLRTVTTTVVDGRHSVWVTHGPREQRRWRACLQRICEPDVPAAGRPTVSQWPVTRARQQPSF